MSTTTQAAAICSPRIQCHPPLARVPSAMATSGERRRRRQRYGRYQVPVSAPEQAIEQAALRRLGLWRRRVRRRRRPPPPLLLPRQHRTRHPPPPPPGTGRGGHLLPPRLLLPPPHGT